MMKFIKNNCALTLVEVLVAVILTAIVMLHGTTFFIATWRLSAESKEYNMVLNDVALNLENYIARPYNNTTSITDDQYRIKTKLLRNKYTVTYNLKKIINPYFNTFGFYYVVSSAKWRYGGDTDSEIRISIKTACAPRWNRQA